MIQTRRFGSSIVSWLDFFSEGSGLTFLSVADTKLGLVMSKET